MVNRNILIAAAIAAVFFVSRRFPFAGGNETVIYPGDNTASSSAPPPGAGIVEHGPNVGTYNPQADLINERYNPANLTRERANKWSKKMLIEAGLYNPKTNAPTAAYYALPLR